MTEVTKAEVSKKERTKEELLDGLNAGTVDPLGLTPEEFAKLQEDETFHSPLMKQYNALVKDESRLTTTIVVLMQKMIAKGADPTFENFEHSINWQVWAMNLTPASKKAVEKRWSFIYSELAKESAKESAEEAAAAAAKNVTPAPVEATMIEGPAPTNRGPDDSDFEPEDAQDEIDALIDSANAKEEAPSAAPQDEKKESATSEEKSTGTV